MRKRVLYITAALVLLTLASCNKNDDDTIPDYLYGNWKISNPAGDTLTLSRIDGYNVARANLTFFPPPIRSDYPFTYRNGKLGIKGGFNSYRANGDYGFFDSFRWVQPGQSFEIMKQDWFHFSASIGDYYTFTKIP